MGVTVIDSTTSRTRENFILFSTRYRKALGSRAETLDGATIKRILVLDDAGLCITSVPADVLRRYAVCAVEQTSQGMFLFEQKPPPFAVISWARAAVKLEIGGPIFSQCFIDKLNTEFLGGKSLRGERLGDHWPGKYRQGRGKSGRTAGQQSALLRSDPDLQLPSLSNARSTRVDSLEELMCVVITCLAVPAASLSEQWPLNTDREQNFSVLPVAIRSLGQSSKI